MATGSKATSPAGIAAAEEADDEGTAEDCRRHSENAEEFGRLLKEITDQYQISYIELDRDISIDKVCDIFTQVNSKGVRLDVFDLINAMVRPKGIQLKKMWREASSELSFVETERMNVYVLQVMSILRQNYCSPKYLYYLLPGQPKTVRSPDGTLEKQVLVQSAEEFEELWSVAVVSLAKAIETPAPSAGIRRDLFQVPAIRIGPPGIRGSATRRGVPSPA